MEPKEILAVGGFFVMVMTIFYNFVYTRAQDKTNAESTSRSLEEVKNSLNTKIDRHISDNEKISANLGLQISRLWEYRNSHEKEASDTRLELQKEIGEIKAVVSVQAGQYAEIVRLIESQGKSLGDKIDKLETRLEKFGHN